MRIAAIVTASLLLAGTALAQQDQPQPQEQTPPQLVQPPAAPQHMQQQLQGGERQWQEQQEQHEQRLKRRQEHPRPGEGPGSPLRQQQPQAVEGPCKRSDQQITIAGVDQDANNCFESNLSQVIDNLGLQLTTELKKEAALDAKHTLLQQDKDALQARLSDAMSKLTYYEQYFESVEPWLEQNKNKLSKGE